MKKNLKHAILMWLLLISTSFAGFIDCSIEGNGDVEITQPKEALILLGFNKDVVISFVTKPTITYIDKGLENGLMVAWDDAEKCLGVKVTDATQAAAAQLVLEYEADAVPTALQYSIGSHESSDKDKVIKKKRKRKKNKRRR